MKKLMVLSTLLFIALNVKAQLSQSELSKLDKSQLEIYLRQSKELANEMKQLEADLFKAEDMIKMGKEMQGDNAKQAGAVHIMRGMNLKEATQKRMGEVRKKQSLLDSAAREAIRNNQKKK